MKNQMQTIKELAGNIKLLYVEDNIGLCNNMKELLSRIFENIIIAHDGKEGYRKYIKYKPKIIITDINLPVMNGFEMIKKIKTSDSTCKIIIMSAHDDKKYLHSAINLDVFRYLSKPAKITELIQAIYDVTLIINEEENFCIFLNQLNNIFNHQNHMVVMMHKGKLILPNQRFLEFFGVVDINEFMNIYPNLDELLLEHKEFLYSTSSSHWYDIITKEEGKLFHTKIKNHKGEMCHLILKLRNIPEKKDHYILSFDDITELNLMAIFDDKTTKSDKATQNSTTIKTLMQVIKNNAAEVKIHNFYKGLTIVNPAVITNIDDHGVTLKTVYSQLKIIQMTNFMTISSDIFPESVVCKSIKSIDMDKQKIVANKMSFALRSATDRKYIRLEVEKKHNCTLFYKQIKFTGDVRIIDISEVSIKIELNALPAGIVAGEVVNVSINLNLNSKLISLLIEATVYRVDTNKRSYDIVLLFELNKKEKTIIKEYLVGRQMALIRAFKKLDVILDD